MSCILQAVFHLPASRSRAGAMGMLTFWTNLALGFHFRLSGSPH